MSVEPYAWAEGYREGFAALPQQSSEQPREAEVHIELL